MYWLESHFSDVDSFVLFISPSLCSFVILEAVPIQIRGRSHVVHDLPYNIPCDFKLFCEGDQRRISLIFFNSGKGRLGMDETVRISSLGFGPVHLSCSGFLDFNL